MQLDQAHREIKEAISRKDILMVIGDCYVE